jgi:hypothetical protein
MAAIANIRTVLTYAFALCFLILIPAIGEASSDIEIPFTITSDEHGLIIRNMSDDYLEIGLAVEGGNFRAEFPCAVSVFLSSRGEHKLAISAKNSARPPEYKIRVRQFSATTTAELRSRRGAKLPPAPPPAPPEVVTKMEKLKCESR